MKKIINLIMTIFLLSCGEDGFKKYEKLEAFRVLGIVSSSPEVADTGEVVTLTPVVSDITNEGREISISISACLDPGVSRGAEVNCEGESFSQEVVYNSGNSVDLNATLGATFFTGVMPTASVTLPTGVLFGKSAIEQYNGVDYLIIFDFKANDESLLKSFKRIKVSTRPIKNSNPTLGVVGSLSLTSEEQSLEVQNSSSKETFDFYSLSGKPEQKSEVMYLTWFTSNGSILNSQVYVDEVSELSFDSSLPNEAVVVVILRDGRGGADFEVVYVN